MLLFLSYIIIYFFNFGLCFAYWQKTYPNLADESYFKDFAMSLVFSLVPFFPMVVIILFHGISGFKGFKYK